MIKGSAIKILGLSMGVASMMATMSNDNNVEAWGCSKSCRKRFGDGNCDDDCNSFECFYDGGDCITSGGYYDYDYDYDYDDDYQDGEPTEAPTQQPTKKPKKGRTPYPTVPTLSPTNKPTSSPTPPTPKPTKATATPTLVGQTANPTFNIKTLSPTAAGIDRTKYNIEIVYVGDMDQKIRNAFVKAQAKWESIIKNDIPNTYTYKKGTKCWETFTKLSQDKIVDDLMIFAQVSNIDGVNGILGQAGPCITSTDPQVYARVGLMQFDAADVAGMVADGSFDAVILHEMGHVIGIGTLWQNYKLAGAPSKFYTGAGGIDGQKKIKGSGKPIVEQQGGEGTAYGHWDEETYDNELMTGYADGNQKMSLLTVNSLKDLGFTVDESKADSYSIPAPKSGLRGEDAKKPKRHLGDDRIHKPIEVVQVDPY